MQGENDFLLGTLPICLAHYITYPDFRALFSGYTLQSPARTVEIDGGTACFWETARSPVWAIRTSHLSWSSAKKASMRPHAIVLLRATNTQW